MFSSGETDDDTGFINFGRSEPEPLDFDEYSKFYLF
jgi:hypothetical protein